MRNLAITFYSALITTLSWSNVEAPIIRTLNDLNRVPIKSSPVLAGEAVMTPTVHLMTAIDTKIVTQMLDEYLHDTYHSDFDIQLDSQLMGPHDDDFGIPTFAMENVVLNANHSRLKADIIFHNTTATRISFNARIEMLTEVPVLSRAMKQGETIQAQDITWQKIPSRRLQGTVLTMVDDIIGRQPRGHLLPSNTPIRKHDVVKQQLIKRGSMVMAYVDNQGIMIQLQAKAMDSGAMGDEVRIQNADSLKILKGVVQESGTVKIQTATSYAVANLVLPSSTEIN